MPIEEMAELRAAEYDVTNLLWKAFQELEFSGFFETRE